MSPPAVPFASVATEPPVKRKAFEREVLRLRPRLLEVQRRLREAQVPVILIVSGVEGAGRNEVVDRLHEWLDTRGIHTAVFWDESDEETERPGMWRFWRQLPARGDITVMFGSWYTRPIVARTFDRIDDARMQVHVDRIVATERMLVDDGAVIIKLWYHISQKEQRKRLKRIKKSDARELTYFEQAYSKRYRRFAEVSAATLEVTDHPAAPWHVLDASQDLARDLATGRLLLKVLGARLRRRPKPRRVALPKLKPAPRLPSVDLTAKPKKKDYEARLAVLQRRLNGLSWDMRDARRSTIVVFEGWDAAGKGGTIRRLTGPMDARLYQVIPIAAPTDEEKAHHYLWRFWRHVPRDGYVRIFDRSWYGRVLVERVEGFAQPDEWRRAYGEIKAFERQLVDHGCVVQKFWLHISPEEQLRRFRERAEVAHKRYKITDEDWRNRGQWESYAGAVEEMVARTSTDGAPWVLVAADSKRNARLTVLEALCDRLEAALT